MLFTSSESNKRNSAWCRERLSDCGREESTGLRPGDGTRRRGEVPGPMFQATLGGRSWQLAEYIGGLGKRGRAGNADAARLTVFAR